MIKGAQKRMIVVRTQDSPVFEEAYFVIRGGKKREERDMIAEANRIIDANGADRRKKKRNVSRAIIIFLCSFMSGSAVGVAITLAVTYFAM